MARLSLLLLVSLALCATPASAFLPPLAGELRDGTLLRALSSRSQQQESSSYLTDSTRATSAHDVRPQGQVWRPTSVRALSMSTPDAATPSLPTPAEVVPAATGPETIITPGAKLSNEWELDVYSRPVVGADGKKLWELLICDSTGNLRHVSPIPSNMVNSREVRRTIEEVIEAAPGGSKPYVIRFFRNAMFNMIDIALKEVEVAVKPCRTTYAMYQWLEERERDVYPNMSGFKATMKQPAFFDIRVRFADQDVTDNL